MFNLKKLFYGPINSNNFPQATKKIDYLIKNKTEINKNKNY